MTVNITTTGSNSEVLEYLVGTDHIEILESVRTLLLAKGWEDLDTSAYDEPPYLYARTYRHLNSDNTTYKIMRLLYYNGFVCQAMGDYDPVTQTPTNLSKNYGNSAYFQKTTLPATENGKLYLFLSDKWFVWLHESNSYTGSSTGGTFTGIFEVEKTHLTDVTPNHVWIAGTLLGNTGTSIVSPVSSFSQDATTSATNTLITTPLGSWGTGQPTTARMYRTLPANQHPFASGKYHAYDMVLSLDPIASRYVKGRIFGLKALSTGQMVDKDIVKIKCDLNYFCDSDGTENDFFVITEKTNNATFAIPL